jgi:hypothetical protein
LSCDGKSDLDLLTPAETSASGSPSRRTRQQR